MAAFSAVVGFGGVLPASATTTVTYGFDGNAHLVVVGGSDTIFTTMQGLSDLWEKDFTVNNIVTGTNTGDTCAVNTSATKYSTNNYPPPAGTPLANQYSNKQLNLPFSQSITGVTNVGTTITATVASTTGLTTGEGINVSGVTGFTTNNPNGQFNVASIPSGTTFTYVVTNAPTGSYTSGGTAVGGSPTPSAPALINCNHDTVAQAYPAGSSTGIASLGGDSGSTAGVFPYEGANSNVAINQPVSVTAINAVTTGTVTAGTALTSVTVASLPAAVGATDNLQISNGTTTQNLTTSGGPYAASTSPVVITVSGTTEDSYSIPGTTANDTAWPTSANGFGSVDLARSSRQPKTSGGNCPASISATGNELACDTFWGFASDEVQVFSWNFGTAQNRGAQLNLLTGGLTADDFINIWDCTYQKWSDIPGLQTAVTGAGQTFTDGPIVPWQMNSGSGTQATFNSWVTNNASSVPTGWTTNHFACDRTLSSGNAPFENDTKPLLTDASIAPYTVPAGQAFAGTYNAGIVDDATSPQDPSNWIWWGSLGLMSAYPYNGSPVVKGPNGVLLNGGNPFNIQAAPIYNPFVSGTTQPASNCTPEPSCTGTNGQTPSTSSIGSYPLSRDLYAVSGKNTADCPLAAGGADCDLRGTAVGGRPTDIQVSVGSGGVGPSGASGVGGAAREFIRFLCRAGASQQQFDPFSPGHNTGVNFDTEVGAVLTANGFARVPLQTGGPLDAGFQTIYKQAGLGRSLGSECSVLSVPNTSPQP